MQTANPTARPTATELETTLKDTYPFFLEFEKLAAGHPGEWKYYGQKYGWSFKVFDGKKALFYVNPKDGYFTVGMAICRELNCQPGDLLEYASDDMNAAKV